MISLKVLRSFICETSEYIPFYNCEGVLCLLIFLIFSFFFFFFFWSCTEHVEVSRPGSKPTLQLQPIPRMQQHQILNPMHHSETRKVLDPDFLRREEWNGGTSISCFIFLLLNNLQSKYLGRGGLLIILRTF